MILGGIAATWLTYLDCMDHKNDVWGVDNARSNSQSTFGIHNKNVQNVIKYTSIKLYNPDIYNQNMFIEHVTNL